MRADSVEEPIVIVRSFWNMLASRLRGVQRGWGGLSLDLACEIWPEHARSDSERQILFDLWYQDETYTRCVEERHGWGHFDRDTTSTVRIGWGSSFGTHRYRHDERVLRRFENPEVAKDPRWRRIVREADEARELNLVLFGWTLSPSGEFECHSSTTPSQASTS